MKQVFMRKNPLGRANIINEEVPVPRCGVGSVVIANGYSLISAGTETASVRRNMKDMVVKAMTDPDIRDSVKDMLFQDGVMKTAERVQFETTKWTAMGYSGAGIAVEVGSQVDGIAEGDLVAYGGEGHAEYIRVEKNLCTRVPEGVSPRDAAFVAVGSIALQAVRRADVQVGDVVAVLGLGLVGQLVSQMLQAAGARVLGSDMIPERIELAGSLGMERSYLASDKLPAEILRHTDGMGVDRVVICASTSSPQVIEQAVAMCRDRARITVVGMVNLNVPCEDFYRKELDLVTSRSYGPGRYDPQYEQQGIDYPVGYVRWTEKRNMQEFLRLVETGKVNVEALVSHEFGLAESDAAYDTLMTQQDRCLAVMLRYEHLEQRPRRKVAVRRVPRDAPSNASSNGGSTGLAVVGCGAFARQFHLPNIQADPRLHLRMMVASSGQSAKEMAVRYGADTCATDFREALDDTAVDAVMIFTRDNAHGPMTVAALEAGKHVFCEKPLATTYEECREIAGAIGQDGPLCMVGFNRRFAPLVVHVKELLDATHGPRVMHYRVNAGTMPTDHWVYDPAQAAGRVVGEVCHFTDLVTWLTGAEPISVFARAVGESPSINKLEDVVATFDYEDGSVATVTYTSAGASNFPKERLEIFTDGTAIALDDYRRLTVRGIQRHDIRNRRADKGHHAEMRHFASAVRGEQPLAITHEDGIRATVCCLKIFESVKSGEKVAIDSSLWCKDD